MIYNISFRVIKNYFLIIFIFISFSLKAQCKSDLEIKKISINDSIELCKVFKKILSEVKNNSEKEFLKLSLGKIDCANCNSDSFKIINYVSNKNLFKNQFKVFEQSAVNIALKKRGFHISCLVFKNYKPKNLPKKYPKDLTLFEIWIQTFLPNELAEGHEGQSNTFQFVKINNKFKLYGLSSIP